MRRLLSITLLLLVVFPLAAPLFAASGEAQLPACCRKAGAHHCMMGAMDESEGPRVVAYRDRCPAFPKGSMPSHTQDWSIAGPSVEIARFAVMNPSLPQIEAQYRISFSRSRQKRGPPAVV